MRSLTLLTLLIVLFIYPTSTEALTCGVFQKKVNDVCIHFDVPPNAHLTYSGVSWDCNRGFKMNSEKTGCEEINIPANSTANYTGSYYCDSGYKQAEDECVKVPKIEHGKFFEFGPDFYCRGGYQKNEKERKCEKIKIPENAREDLSSLDGWRCFRGYIKQGNECKKFNLPEHGYWAGDFWKCEPGYKKNFNNNSCDKISIPENAHPSDTFDGWVCNPGYTKNHRDNRCDKIDN